MAVSEVVAVPILDYAAGEQGGPDRYVLTLINDPSRVPRAVTEAGLEVDFSRQSIVYLGMGERPTLGYSVEITGLQQVGRELFVQAAFSQPKADEMAGEAITTPWTAVTVSKRTKVKLRSDFRDAE